VKNFDSLEKTMKLAVERMNDPDNLALQPKGMFEQVAKTQCEEAEETFRKEWDESWREYENTHTDDWDEEKMVSHTKLLEQGLLEKMRNKLKQQSVPEAMVEQAVEAISGVVEATRKDNAHRQILQKKDSQLEVKDSQLEVVSGPPIASRKHREPLKNETIIVTKCRHLFGLPHSRVNFR
jgi:hypothetical protein